MSTPVEVRVSISTDEDVVRARIAGREVAATLGFTSLDQTLICTAISELARNIYTHAKTGELVLKVVTVGERVGMCVIARDGGPGIRDLGLAMSDAWSSTGQLGLGLPGTRRLMDEFEITSKPGAGTLVIVKKWLRKL